MLRKQLDGERGRLLRAEQRIAYTGEPSLRTDGRGRRRRPSYERDDG